MAAMLARTEVPDDGARPAVGVGGQNTAVNRPGRAGRPAPRVPAIVAGAILVLLVTACGAPPSHVAQLRPTTTRPPSSSGPSGKGGTRSSAPPNAQPLAFSRCMRAHGVANFPDPNSSGVWPKSQVEDVASSPRFSAATGACGHLLPDGGPGVAPSPAVVQQIQDDMAKFTRCMRAHGVPNWPSPSIDRGRAVFDPAAAGIDPSSPQVSIKMEACAHVFPASIGLPPGA